MEADANPFKQQLRDQNLFPHTSAPWQQAVLAGLLARHCAGKRRRALDAASGIGNNLATLLPHAAHVQAVDASSKALQFSKTRHPRTPVSFQVADIHSLPFNNGHFDIAVCTEALEHCVSPARVVAELHRVTKPGGVIILSAQNHCNLTAPMKFIAEKLLGRNNWDAWGTHGHDEGYENYLTARQLRRMVEQVGFRVIEDCGADYLNAWLSWLPFVYRNYPLLDAWPLLPLGKLPGIKYLGMDYFIALAKD